MTSTHLVLILVFAFTHGVVGGGHVPCPPDGPQDSCEIDDPALMHTRMSLSESSVQMGAMRTEATLQTGDFCCAYPTDGSACAACTVRQTNSWCAKSKKRCEQCSGKWCGAHEPTPPPIPGFCCYWHPNGTDVCACGPNYKVPSGGWCGKSPDRCAQCFGSWCYANTLPPVTQTPTVAPTTTQAPPTVTPTTSAPPTPTEGPTTQTPTVAPTTTQAPPTVTPTTSAPPTPTEGPTTQPPPVGNCSDPDNWKQARWTTYESLPLCCERPSDTWTSPDDDECIHYNACQWAGWFAYQTEQKDLDWVKAHRIIAFYEYGCEANDETRQEFTRRYALKDIYLRHGSKQVKGTIYDTCGDNDCGGCCSRNSAEGGGYLVDVERWTLNEWFGYEFTTPSNKIEFCVDTYAGTPPPVVTTTPGGGGCSDDWQNCMYTRCCNDPSQTCFKKDAYWASCRESCVPGSKYDDPPWDTPWSCEVLD